MKFVFVLMALVTSFAVSSQAAYKISDSNGQLNISFDPNSTQSVSRYVDVIFVVDDSGSMGGFQQSLANNIRAIVGQLQGADIHAGVITTTADNSTGKPAGYMTWVSNQSKDWQSTLSGNLLVGTNGSATEMPFVSLAAALNDRTGFFREHADLVVVLLTDGEDMSGVTSTSLAQTLISFKGNDASRIGFHGLLIPTAERKTCATSGEDAPQKIEEVIANFKGIVGSLCDDARFKSGVEQIGKDIIARAKTAKFDGKFVLPLAAKMETLKVSYGNKTLFAGDMEYGWTYAPSNRTLTFGSKIDWNAQPAGTMINIQYTPVSWRN